jgi:formamidopyrimidine-DNA glycosylase
VITVPEIPELEVLKENLGRLIKGKVLKELRIIKPYVQRTTVPGGLIGQRVTGITRRGKYITIDLEGHRLIIHLMLKGRFKPLAKDKPPYKTAAALLEFEDASVQLVEDTKLKRMSMWIVDKSTNVDDIKPLGVEPLSDDFTQKRLEELLANSRERLKNFLLNQRNIAGIGNAYADEICWSARLSPFKQAGKLTKDEMTRLYSAIGQTLLEATKKIRKLTGEGIAINEERPFMAVHRRRGEPCPRCGRKVEWVSTTSRDTFYCPGCQTEGRILKDGRSSRFLKGN